MKLRDLLPRVAYIRPDLIKENGEAYFIWALSETSRCISRSTNLYFETQTPFILNSNTHTTTLSSLLGEVTLLRKVVVASLPGSDINPTQSLGTFDASTGSITPHYGSISTLTNINANSFPVYGFYMCSKEGNFIVDNNNVLPWSIGDVVITNGNTWSQHRLDCFHTVGIGSFQTINHWYSENQRRRQLPTQCAKENNTLYWFPPPRYTTVAQITISVVPNSINWNVSPPQYVEIDDLFLPVEAEECIIQGAFEILYRTPGAMQDIKSAELAHKRYEIELSGLKSMGIFGQSGSSYFLAPSFTGRATAQSPYNMTNRNGGNSNG